MPPPFEFDESSELPPQRHDSPHYQVDYAAALRGTGPIGFGDVDPEDLRDLMEWIESEAAVPPASDAAPADGFSAAAGAESSPQPNPKPIPVPGNETSDKVPETEADNVTAFHDVLNEAVDAPPAGGPPDDVIGSEADVPPGTVGDGADAQEAAGLMMEPVDSPDLDDTLMVDRTVPVASRTAIDAEENHAPPEEHSESPAMTPPADFGGPSDHAAERCSGNDVGPAYTSGFDSVNPTAFLFEPDDATVPAEAVTFHHCWNANPGSEATSGVVGATTAPDEDAHGPKRANALPPPQSDAAFGSGTEGPDVAPLPAAPEPDHEVPPGSDDSQPGAGRERAAQEPQVDAVAELDVDADPEAVLEHEVASATDAASEQKTVTLAKDGSTGKQAPEVSESGRVSGSATERETPNDAPFRELMQQAGALFLAEHIAPVHPFSPEMLGARAASFAAAPNPFSKFVGFVTETTVFVCTGDAFGSKCAGTFAEHFTNLLIQDDFASSADGIRSGTGQAILAANATVDLFHGNAKGSLALKTLLEQYGMTRVDAAFKRGVDALTPVVNDEVRMAPPQQPHTMAAVPRHGFAAAFTARLDQVLQDANLRAVIEQHWRVETTGCPRAVTCTREQPCLRCRNTRWR
ncbi:hypothetical protein LO763_19620 [Glycomyces sp. A-F 0318]|uniref:hypothetical protein n=1 Tax=Glycomyces amatae TaxID=2881355 RepID=UPI001E40AB7E|nr:hypothetical protein [Glycomyces amatae]MCD0445821.1 hypothetical protein [Glycomyces amatae]